MTEEELRSLIFSMKEIERQGLERQFLNLLTRKETEKLEDFKYKVEEFLYDFGGKGE